MDLAPRMTTFEAPPTPDDEALMFRPATLPLSALMKLAFFTPTISSLATCWALYERAFSERLMPRAVTTTASTLTADSTSVKSIVVRDPTVISRGS